MRFGLDFQLETETEPNRSVSIKKTKLIRKFAVWFRFRFFFFLQFSVLDWFGFEHPSIYIYMEFPLEIH